MIYFGYIEVACGVQGFLKLSKFFLRITKYYASIVAS